MWRKSLNNIATSDLWAALLIFIFALVLRLIHLFSVDIWVDEANIIFFVEKSFKGIWNFCKTDNFPPLYPWLIKIWDYFLPGAMSLRIFSSILGALTPPMAYFLGKELLNRKLGWLLALGCAISASMLYYSQMIRMYALFPFFACLSIYSFLRALKTNRWKFWAITALANLLGFYTFLFMIFVITVEVVILPLHYRFKPRALLRPLVAHIPTAILISFWIIPLLQRYSQVEQSFWVPPVSEESIARLWILLGTGVYFRHHFIIVFLMNVPFVLGILIGLPTWWKNEALRIALAFIVVTIATIYIHSLFGQSLFFKRYFLFLLPLYLALALTGWLQQKKLLWRRLGLSVVLLSLLASTVYYYADYNITHSEYRFTRPYGRGGKCEGHAISRIAAKIGSMIQEDEVIIHYSNPMLRSFSYFPMVYYHKRAFPEYIYAAFGVPNWAGRQYLRPQDMIHSLYDLQPLPMGVWMVSLDSTEAFFHQDDVPYVEYKLCWIYEENLPKELKESGFNRLETLRCGKVTAIHFRRKLDDCPRFYRNNISLPHTGDKHNETH